MLLHITCPRYQSEAWGFVFEKVKFCYNTSMNFQDCLNFANKVSTCAVATAQGDQPRVRMLGLWSADEAGFYFQAWDFKEIYKQLKANPKIEICFHSNMKEEPNMLRVSGEVEFIDDVKLKEKVFQDRPFLKSLGATGPDDPRIIIFRIAHGQASFWPIKKAGEYPTSENIAF
jgi:pyridoxamine 5'-phosphate oxidase